jgi:thioesterase domain-containing protein
MTVHATGRLGFVSVLAWALSVIVGGCSTNSAPTPGFATGSTGSAIIGTVPSDQIQAPPPGLAQAFGVSPARVAEGIAAAKKFDWQLVKTAGVIQVAACVGSGAPTVVYNNGLGFQASWTWPLVAVTQAQTNRVCMFDRPGTGLSPARPAEASPNGPLANANEMFALMKALGEQGPFLLVGWSYGGAVARTAAAIAPESVVGMNLVDAVSPTQYRTFDGTGWVEGDQNLDMAAAEKAVGTTGPNFGDKPLVVLVAGVDPAKGSQPSAWTNAQRQAAGMSTDSVLAIVTGVPHPIPQINPQAVVAATTAVSTAITTSTALAKCPQSFASANLACIAY